MSDLKLSEIVSVNLPVIVMNIITSVVWDGMEGNEWYDKTVQKYDDLVPSVEKDMNKEEIEREFNRFILSLETQDGFYSWIDRVKVTYIAKSFTDLMKIKELPFKTRKQLQKFIIQTIIPQIMPTKLQYATHSTAENNQVGCFGYIGTYPTQYERVTPIYSNLILLFRHLRENGIRA